jgi:hypothetical protein
MRPTSGARNQNQFLIPPNTSGPRCNIERRLQISKDPGSMVRVPSHAFLSQRIGLRGNKPLSRTRHDAKIRSASDIVVEKMHHEEFVFIKDLYSIFTSAALDHGPISIGPWGSLLSTYAGGRNGDSSHLSLPRSKHGYQNACHGMVSEHLGMSHVKPAHQSHQL